MRVLTLFLLLLVGGCVTTFAQSGGAVMKLTLSESIELALSDNPTIKIAQLEVERYDYVRKTTMSGLMPQLSVDGGLNRTLVTQNMAEGLSMGGDKYNTISASGNLSMALYAPAVYRTLKMNRTEAEVALESARESKIDLVAAVKSSYYGVLLAQYSLKVLEASSLTAKQTVDETEVKYRNGLSSEYDLLTAQVQYSTLQPTIVQTRASIEIAKDMLKMYLSIPQSIKIELSEDLLTLNEEMTLDAGALSRDLSNNTTLRSLALSQRLLDHQLKINNASRLPVLAAYGLVTYTGSNTGSFSFGGSTIGADSYYWQYPSSVGLTLSFPIFDGMARHSRSRQIENQISQMELQRAYAEESMQVSLSSAISNIFTAQQSAKAQLTTVEQAKKAYSISNTRYVAGAGTILELNTSQLAMTQAELNYLQAIYDLLVAHSEYDKIVGSEF